MIEEDFGHWFAGFTDGEGCFYIRHGHSRPGRHQWTCEFSISLRLDDISILQDIQRRTGLGRISIDDSTTRINPLAKWTVHRKADSEVLLGIFDRFPLRAKKRRDFAIWRQAVLIRARMRPRGNDWTRIAALYEELKSGRQFNPAPLPEVEPPQLKLFTA